MKINLKSVLFLDIETVPQHETYNKVPKPIKELWKKKFEKKLEEGETITQSWQKAGLYAEYGKIVCISIGAAYSKGAKTYFKLESFYGEDEKALLNEFVRKTEGFMTASVGRTMCGHNGKSFDFPFIARRLILNGIQLPEFLNNMDKKPWEINLLDTMELWKLGDFKHYVSLNTLTNIFGIPSPKDDIDGSQVANVYYKEKDLDRIAKYCEKDVVATAKVFCKILQIDGFEDPEPLQEGK